jgi:hypothetical protein
MKTSLIISIAFLLAALGMLARFLLQRQRMKKADKTGTVVYATFLSLEPVKMFGKEQQDLVKVNLRVQDPGSKEPRDVSIRTRLAPGQRFTPGSKIPVVIDPKDPKKIYPASEEAAKRAVVTGSRLERRVMQQQIRTPGRGAPSMPSGYQPPTSSIRPKR